MREQADKRSIESKQLAAMLLKMHEAGIRFYTETDLDDTSTGFLEEIEPGVYRLTTLKGFLLQAEKGKFTWKGKTLTRDQAELFVNVFAFMCKTEFATLQQKGHMLR
jgi:hypothetical protein